MSCTGRTKCSFRVSGHRYAAAAAAASEQQTDAAIIRPATRHRFQEIGQLFAAGESLEQIAQHSTSCRRRLFSISAISTKPAEPLTRNACSRRSRLPGPERARVFGFFERLGHQRLAPVYEALARAIPYRELHLLRLYWLLTLN